MLDIAASVSAAFCDAGRSVPDDVKEAVGSSLKRMGRPSDDAAVLRACWTLHDLGYIWTVNYEGRPYYEPGIPSLMRHVARASASGTQERSG